MNEPGEQMASPEIPRGALCRHRACSSAGTWEERLAELRLDPQAMETDCRLQADFPVTGTATRFQRRELNFRYLQASLLPVLLLA